VNKTGRPGTFALCSAAVAIVLFTLLFVGSCKSRIPTNTERGSDGSAAHVTIAPGIASRSASATLPGLPGRFFRAAREVMLTDVERAALERLELQFERVSEPQNALTLFNSDLVAFIRMGKFEAARPLLDDLEALRIARAELELQSMAALGALHASLSPEHRRAVADIVRARLHFGPVPSPGAPKKEATRELARVERLGSRLGLDHDQQIAADKIMLREDSSRSIPDQRARYDATKKKADMLLSAFEAAQFDCAQIDVSPIPGGDPTEWEETRLTLVEGMLQVLNAGQREAFAAIIEGSHTSVASAERSATLADE
jgi:hypothetical protein